MREIRERDNDKYELFNAHLGFIIRDVLLKLQQDRTLTRQTMKNITESFEEFRKNWKQIVDSWKQITDSWTIALDGIIKASSRFQEFIKKVEERIPEGEEILKRVMSEPGYWYTPSFMEIPMVDILEAYNNYLKGNKSAMTNFFKRVYHKNNYWFLRKTVNGWNKNTFFQSRMRIIVDALDAHCSKKYTLSIPALLLVVEGIATDYCKKAGIDITKKTPAKKKIQKALEDKRSKTELNILFLDLFFYHIEEVIYKNTEELKKAKFMYKSFLNRHAVLHGIQKNYDTTKNSLQCFMLLDVLSLL
ncbi:hypothetical protein KAX35_02310 [candidate division WOR-3 bacterium]|nr:hypothetical protein [candidate division WOR-3 bacterium]